MHVRWSESASNFDSFQKPANKSGSKEKIEDSLTQNKTVTSDLFQAFFPIYHLSKACGLLPVKFVEQTPHKYEGRLSVLGIAYSVCLLILLVGGQLWGLYRDLRDGWEHSTRMKSHTAGIVTCSDVLGIMVLTSVSVLGSPFRWKHMQTVLDKLFEVDQKLAIVAPKKTRRFSVALSVATLTYLWILSFLDFYCWDRETKTSKKRSDKGAVNYMGLYFMYTVIFAMEIQYAVATYNVGQRFDRLNKSLDNILKSGKISEQFRKDLGLAGDLRGQTRLTSHVKPDLAFPRHFRKTRSSEWRPTLSQNVSHLVTVHAALCDTVFFINKTFGAAILFVTLTCLLHLIITPYFLILEADGNRESLFLAVQGLWCILHVYRILIIVQPTYDAASKATKTAVLVSRLLSTESEAEVRKQLEIFSLQLLHRPLEFSVCGLFSVDRALVTSIAGAVTTYLVILIQFQKADDQKGEINSVDSIIKNATQILKNASSLHNFTTFKFNP